MKTIDQLETAVARRLYLQCQSALIAVPDQVRLGGWSELGHRQACQFLLVGNGAATTHQRTHARHWATPLQANAALTICAKLALLAFNALPLPNATSI